MIRARARSVRLSLFYAHPSTTVIFARRLQTIPTKKAPKSDVPPLKDARKPHVQLRPAPIKVPKTVSLAPPPAPPAAHESPHPTVQTTEPLSLKSLKETTVRDIADAESHGILVPPPPGAGWAKSTLHKAIQLAKFYFRGVKLVYTRSKIARTIQHRVKTGGAPLERWEYRMLHTQRADMKRLVPFVLTALILEEIIPLIVLYAPSMLPSTCILPSQRDRIQEKATDKALELLANHKPVLASLTKGVDSGEIPLNALSGQDVTKTICGLLRLSTFGIDSLRIQRIRRHLAHVEKDDALLTKEGLRGLSPQDLLQALHERGINTRDLDNSAQVQKLKWWLKSVNAKENTVARRVYLVALLGTWQ
ncbi:hypothetical protein B0H15DRAFT_859709 [Mycena belliarum]|uniref:Letm1 RBD domain-containing protein n=1 Tax=Mycena belliarum TaxID=1033014 RepID=A0AAD6XJG5_9AGAR|nr:hypothetical protein B0H15DRAFT_859709 [Mycena belliae]